MFIKSLNAYNKHIPEINTSILDYVNKDLLLRVAKPIKYKNSKLYFLDLTTLSETGTFKDIVGSYIIGYCIQNNIAEFVTQSSGNTANSIAYYASKHKIKATILYPKRSRYKINSVWYSDEWVKFIELDKPEQVIKDFTQSISEYLDVPWLPRMKHQIISNKIRAHFIDDFIKKENEYFDFTSQSLSSGYGIFGLYMGFSEIQEKNYDLPSLIGVQQERIKPYKIYIYNDEVFEDEIIEPTLFRSKPTSGMLEDMKKIVRDTNGFILSISSFLYNEYEERAKELLYKRGIDITIVKNQIIEKAGLLSLIGTMKAIDDKLVKENSRVLVTITGGLAKGNRNSFKPKYKVKINDSFERVKEVLEK